MKTIKSILSLEGFEDEQTCDHEFVMSAGGVIVNRYDWQNDRIEKNRMVKLKSDNVIISAPPGAGKTWVVVASILQWLYSSSHGMKKEAFPSGLVLVTAPFRTLCQQLHAEIKEAISKANSRWDMKATCRLCVGEDQSHKHTSDSVIICTFEHARVFMMKANRPERHTKDNNVPSRIKDRLKMLFIDEVQMITDFDRGHIIDEILFLANLFSSNVVVQGLSGTLSRIDEAIFRRMGFGIVRADAGDKKFWVNVSKIKDMHDIYITMLSTAKFLIYSNVINYLKKGYYSHSDFRSTLSTWGFGMYVFCHMKFSEYNIDSMYPTDAVNTALLIKKIILDKEDYLIDTSIDGKRPIKIWMEYLDHVRKAHDIDLDSIEGDTIFGDGVKTKDTTTLEEYKELLRLGIAIHHADYRPDILELVIKLMVVGAVKIVVCTTTLATGVSVKDFNRVFVMQSKRNVGNKGDVPIYPNKTIIQMIGRSARNMMGYAYIYNDERKFNPWSLPTELQATKNKDHMVGCLASYVYTETADYDHTVKCLKNTYCSLISSGRDSEHLRMYEGDDSHIEEDDKHFKKILDDPKGSYKTMLSMINELGVFSKDSLNDAVRTLKLTPIGKLVIMGKGSPVACEQVLRTLMLIAKDMDNLNSASLPLPVSSLAPMYIIAMMLASGTVSPVAKKDMKIHPKQDIAFGSYLYHEASRIITSITDMCMTPDQFSGVYNALKKANKFPSINKDHQKTLDGCLFGKNITKEDRKVAESISGSLLAYTSINNTANAYNLPEDDRQAREPVTMSKLSQINRVLRTYASKISNATCFTGDNKPVHFAPSTIKTLLMKGVLIDNNRVATIQNEEYLHKYLGDNGYAEEVLEYDKNGIRYMDVVSRYMSFVHYTVDCCYSLIGIPDQAETYFAGGSRGMIYSLIKFVRNIRMLSITSSDLRSITFKRRIIKGDHIIEEDIFSEADKAYISKGFMYFNHIVEQFFNVVIGDKDVNYSKKNFSLDSTFPQVWYRNKSTEGSKVDIRTSLVRLVLEDRIYTKKLVYNIWKDSSLNTVSKLLGYLPGNMCIFVSDSIKELTYRSTNVIPIVVESKALSPSVLSSAIKQGSTLNSSLSMKIIFESDTFSRDISESRSITKISNGRFSENADKLYSLLLSKSYDNVLSSTSISFYNDVIKGVLKSSGHTSDSTTQILMEVDNMIRETCDFKESSHHLVEDEINSINSNFYDQYHGANISASIEEYKKSLDMPILTYINNIGNTVISDDDSYSYKEYSNFFFSTSHLVESVVNIKNNLMDTHTEDHIYE